MHPLQQAVLRTQYQNPQNPVTHDDTSYSQSDYKNIPDLINKKASSSSSSSGSDEISIRIGAPETKQCEPDDEPSKHQTVLNAPTSPVPQETPNHGSQSQVASVNSAEFNAAIDEAEMKNPYDPHAGEQQQSQAEQHLDQENIVASADTASEDSALAQ
eukprot:15360011-Ditylum_brightwellii.AAC.1